eukprot:GHVQ01007969.1.p1 GENE.GHVQ01007969.1~~GHVQ01007969.1.p1  ORF type:complete len:223 (-),score=36.19 GHVQ01007969.1:413-1081(-)
MVIGSAMIFSNEYIDKESNMLLQEAFISWLIGDSDIDLGYPYGEEPECLDYVVLPDSKSMADKLLPGLQDSEPLPRDFTLLFDDTLFKFDTSLIPDVLKCYADLQLKDEPLSLIPPQFETPVPPLQPAVYPPKFKQPQKPSLELYDLEEQLASARTQLAQLTQKCDDTDLEYYVLQAAEIVGITKGSSHTTAKEVLENAFWKLAQFRCGDGYAAATTTVMSA